jgi:TatD DNase family protein
MELADSHCHLQDPKLRDALPLLLEQSRALGIGQWVVNATRETDWPEVAALSKSTPGLRAAFGLHPWWQNHRTSSWRENLVSLLSSHTDASIGEIGLDLWIHDANIKDQIAVLREHLEIAKLLGRPVTIHCLRAWPHLLDVMRNEAPPPRGFLLHSYSGPVEMIQQWTELGAFFSFSPAFLNPNKTHIRRMFQSEIPLNRLLIETDAPDMAAQKRLSRYEVPPLAESIEPPARYIKRLNHPANLILCLEAIAADRSIPQEQAAELCMENFYELFGHIEKAPINPSQASPEG